MNLYLLQRELREIFRKIDDGGEISEEMVARIDALHLETKDKVDTIFRAIKTAAACERAAGNEIAYMSKRKRSYGLLQDRLREQLKSLLITLGVTEYHTDLCNPTICYSPPSVELASDFDAKKLIGTPWESLVSVSYEISAAKIKELEAAGLPMPEGVRVVRTNTHVRL